MLDWDIIVRMTLTGGEEEEVKVIDIDKLPSALHLVGQVEGLEGVYLYQQDTNDFHHSLSKDGEGWRLDITPHPARMEDGKFVLPSEKGPTLYSWGEVMDHLCEFEKREEWISSEEARWWDEQEEG